MATRAYSDVYLSEAKRHLGVATDYLVNVCGFAADRVGTIYSCSPVAELFANGDPGIVAGMSGTELGQRFFAEIPFEGFDKLSVFGIAADRIG